jgi:hypothetical protein
LVSGSIYVIQDDQHLIEVRERAYDSEDLLQGLLAKYPNLLAGDQIDSASPRRWLLVAREMPLASDDDGAARWSLDHLFLDQDGVPTLVEVKRSTDTRIRREVVGQMLDYAANALLYWPVETIAVQFKTDCEKRAIDSELVLSEFLGAEKSPEDFWQKVKTNLQARRVRLIFVADVIPLELRRIVEFLAEQMDPAEIFAVEVRQYVGKNLKTLVPRVVSQVNPKKAASGPRQARQWDEPSFLRELANRGNGEEEIAQKILKWANDRHTRIWWGRGTSEGSFLPMVDQGKTQHWTVAVRTGSKTAYVEVPFRDMGRVTPFDDETKRQELRDRLNEIPGISIPADALAKYPRFPLSLLSSDSALGLFLDALDWAVAEIRAI